MKGMGVVIAKEWKCFTGSDRGTFILYVVLILIWSSLLAARTSDNFSSGPLWLVFFSIVITSNFASTVFISERFNGALEIFITSGLSRDAILFGKIVFITAISLIFGGLCVGISVVIEKAVLNNDVLSLSISDFLLYASATFFNVAGSAYLSVRMSNNRLLHIINMFMLGGIVTGYTIVSSIFTTPEIYLLIILNSLALIFCVMARRLYHTEKIIQPLNM